MAKRSNTIDYSQFENRLLERLDACREYPQMLAIRAEGSLCRGPVATLARSAIRVS